MVVPTPLIPKDATSSIQAAFEARRKESAFVPAYMLLNVAHWFGVGQEKTDAWRAVLDADKEAKKHQVKTLLRGREKLKRSDIHTDEATPPWICACARVVHTLRDWGTPADEAHFVGVRPKAPILKALGAHIFFDDQEKHVLGASQVVPSGHVPGPHDPDEPIIPAGV